MPGGRGQLRLAVAAALLLLLAGGSTYAVTGRIDFSAAEGYTPTNAYQNISNGVPYAVVGIPGLTATYRTNWGVEGRTQYANEAESNSVLGAGYARPRGPTNTITFNQPVYLQSIAYTTFGNFGYSTSYQFIGSSNGVIMYRWTNNSPPPAWTYTHFTNGSSTVIDKLTIGVTGSGDQIGALDSIILSSVTNAAAKILSLAPLAITNTAHTQTAAYTAIVDGFQPLTFQWYKIAGGVTNALADSGNISGSKSNILTISNTTVTNAGGYFLWVTNLYGRDTSAVANLTIVFTPNIASLSPLSVTNYEPLQWPATFTAVVTGDTPLTYQWYKIAGGVTNALSDGGKIHGSRTNALTITTNTVADTGGYFLWVTNTYGMATSAVANLTVLNENATRENMTFPSGSTVINITKAPYNAKGDGVTDCTAAIQRAMNDYTGHGVMIYFPNGTYMVSNSLVWANHDSLGVQAWGNTYIQGQSRDGTIIKAKSGSFSSAVMSCVGFGSADWFNNYVQNITFDTGGGWALTGLQFYSNNDGAIRDVKIIGPGNIGLDLSANMNGPLLVKNLVVQGFDTGIKCGNSVNSQTFEHITLTGQTSAGFNNGGQTISVRDLSFSGAAKAVQTSGGLLSLIDADLTRTSGSGEAISDSGGFLHVRNLTTSGYSQAISCTGVPHPVVITGPNVTEFFSHIPTSPFPSSTNSLNLPIQETPDVSWWDDPTKWVNVESYGAVPDGATDSRAAIQAAIDSGATTIWFPGSYSCNGAVYVRGNARRLLSVGGFVNYNSQANVCFIVTNGTSPNVVFEHFSTLGLEQINTTRNVAYRSCGIYRITQLNASGNLYLEDTCPSSLSLKGNVWARQLNPEIEGVKIVNDGGNLWVLGLKTERSGSLVVTTNGGKSEIFGNFSYTTTHVTPGAMFVNDNSSMFTEFTEVCYSGQPFDNIIQETRGGSTITVPRASGWVAPYIGHTNQGGGSPPAPDFTASTNSGMPPLTVIFTDTSTNNPTRWSWTFGDGGVSTARKPSHQYTTAGIYTVVLTTVNAYGTNTNTKTDYITVGSPAPTANFSGTPTNGAAPLTVNFTNTSTGSFTNSVWTFGDGGSLTTNSGTTASYTYNTPGSNTVQLIVTGLGGSATNTRPNYIVVLPTVGIASSPDGMTITFIGTLQASGDVTGPWTNVIGATSPLIITNLEGRMFYRTTQ